MDDQRLDNIRRDLEKAGVETAQKDIDEIWSHANGDAAAFEVMIARRMKREPLERIFGEAVFYELDFTLAPGVFKPGFESETTLEYGLIALKDKAGPLRILDLGTGTGCILLTLLHHLPRATGLGVDLTGDSITIAEQNAVRHGLSDRSSFKQSDWLKAVTAEDGLFDLVIANPPRTPTAAVPLLVHEVSKYDPHSSLDGGQDGIEFYRRTASDIRRVLKADGCCIIQVGTITANHALHCLQKAGFATAAIRRDYKMAPNCILFGNDPVKPTLWQRLWRRSTTAACHI